MHTAEGTVIDVSALPARRRWLPITLSTPTGLKVAMVATVVLVALFGVAATRAALDRRASADDVVDQAGPLLIDAQDLYVALAGADAAASTSFLRAGLEPSELRAQYLDDLGRAGERLTAVANSDLGPEAAAAAQTLGRELPIYADRVEAARTNSRLGFLVGAAYLRRASELMRTEILPAATAIYEDAALELDDRYTDGMGRPPLVAVAVTASLTLLAVVLTQLFVTSRSRRCLNAGLLIAAAMVVAAAVTTWLVLDHQANALAESRDDGADLATTLATARIVTRRSLSDENLDLIERGTEEGYIEDFDRRVDSLGIGSDDGLLDRAVDAAPDRATRDALASIEERYTEYLAAHDEVRRRLEERDYGAAVDIAVNPEADAAQAVDAELSELIERSSAALSDDADRAREFAFVLPILVVLATIAAGVAVVIGLQPRLREFR